MTSDNRVEVFFSILKELDKKTASISPKKVNSSIKYLLSRSGEEKFPDLDALVAALATNKASARHKKNSRDIENVDELVASLEELSSDKIAFDAYADKLNNKLGAASLKKVVAVFGKTRLPKTKAEALRLLKAIRSERERYHASSKEAAKSTPW